MRGTWEIAPPWSGEYESVSVYKNWRGEYDETSFSPLNKIPALRLKPVNRQLYPEKPSEFGDRATEGGGQVSAVVSDCDQPSLSAQGVVSR